jgi:drug/metabolite transporter (DMT)-like permease
VRPGLAARAGALAAIVLWGLSFVATKAALAELAPAALLWARFALGTALLFALLVARGEARRPPAGAWRALVLLGFVGVFVHHTVQVWGLKFTTAVHTGWLIGLIPIWSALLAALFLGERLTARRGTGLALGLAGALLVITRGRLDAGLLALPTTRGDLLVLVSTVNWAVYTILARRGGTGMGARASTAWAMLLGWLMLAPLFFAAGGFATLAHLSAATWGAIAFLGFGCSGLGYLFWYGALERLEASQVAAFLYLEPLVTLAAAMALLGEPVGVATMAGGLTVLAGVALVQRPAARAGGTRRAD